MTRRTIRSLTAITAMLLLAGAVISPSPAAAASSPHPHRKPWPITITVQTVPPLAHIRLTLDGTLLTTDANGRAAFTRQHNFEQHTLVLLDAAVNTADQRYQFTRWAGQRDPDQAFRTTVTGLPMRANYTITAAFTVRYPVTARFVDQNGRSLDPAEISTVKIRNDDGNLVDFPASGTIWLDGKVPTYRKSILRIRNVSYSLQTVLVNGTNVVDAGKQRFQPAVTTNLTFTTQFHDLTIQAHDALFGEAIGATAKVTYPDGSVHVVPFGTGHTVMLDHLPRGQYTVDVDTAGGVAFRQQFRLSRAKSVDIIVVSRSDQITVVLALLLLAIGLLVVGRAPVRRALLRPVHRATVRLERLVSKGEAPSS